MDETAKLRARIAAVQGLVEHRRQRSQPYPPPSVNASSSTYRGRGGGRGASRGRGGRAGYQPVQNRVWRAGGNQSPPSTDSSVVRSADESGTPSANNTSANGFYIQRDGFGKQELLSKETYERKQKQKQEYEQSRAVDQREAAQAPDALTGSTPPKTEQSTRQITIEGMAFVINHDGSKLVRVADVFNALQETPRKAMIAGVEFLRTKRGNLVRAPAQKDMTRFNNAAPKPQCETFTKQGKPPSVRKRSPSGWPVLRIRGNLATSSCPFGPKCRYAHDPEKVAICKTLLLTGKCTAGDYCDLSHEMSYHRVSACSHFLRGNCTNDACRYPHVNIAPSSPVCRAFATLGYCASGAQCSRRHVFECPDYANRGVCTNNKCQLPHVDRASTLRKAAQRQAKVGTEGESDVSSDDEVSDQGSEVDGIDLGADDAVMTGLDDSHELSQQQDYISFT